MTNALGGLLLMAGIAATAVITKPTDEECIDQVSAYYDSGLVTGLHAGMIIYQVHDHVFYKTISNRFTGTDIGTGAFSTVFF